jgi:hypothetical protein
MAAAPAWTPHSAYALPCCSPPLSAGAQTRPLRGAVKIGHFEEQMIRYVASFAVSTTGGATWRINAKWPPSTPSSRCMSKAGAARWPGPFALQGGGGADQAVRTGVTSRVAALSAMLRWIVRSGRWSARLLLAGFQLWPVAIPGAGDPGAHAGRPGTAIRSGKRTRVTLLLAVI